MVGARKKILLIICAVCLITVAGLLTFFLVANDQRPTDTVIDEVTILGAGGYGAVFNAQIDPFNANYFAATCDMGSVYFSFNQGKNWTRHNLQGTVYCLEYDPTSNGVVWAAGSGVYKSTDHGKTMQMVFPKPEQITSAGNNYENANYWIYSDGQSDYVPHYQIWSLAINRKSHGQNVYVAQRIAQGGMGVDACVRIYQTKNAADFAHFIDLPYEKNFHLDYDESNDCLVYVTENKIIEIDQNGNLYQIDQAVTLQFSNGNNFAFDSYYDVKTATNTFVFAAPCDQLHVASACYQTNNLRDQSSYIDLTAQLCQLKTDDFGIDDLPDYNQGLASYEYCEWIDGGKDGKNGYVPQQFKWTITNVAVIDNTTIYLYHEAHTDTFGTDSAQQKFLYINRRTSLYLKYDPILNQFKWVYGMPLKPYRDYIENTTWQDSDIGYCFGLSSTPANPNALLFSNVIGVYYTNDGQTVSQLNSIKQGAESLTLVSPNGTQTSKELSRLTTTGVDVLCTQTLVTDPFDTNHLLMGCTDVGLLQSYDNGASWYHALYEWDNENLKNINYAAYTNTCFDLHFDTHHPVVVYALWSLAKTAPYAPNEQYFTMPSRFGISYDGGLSWTMKKITADGCGLPYRMQVIENAQNTRIYVTMDGFGFYVSDDMGETFQPMNQGIATVEFGERKVIWGNRLLVCDLGIFAITGGNASVTDNGTMLYQWNEKTEQFDAIGLPTVDYESSQKKYSPAAIRDLTYDAKHQCLYLACTANNVTNYRQMEHIAGGIWRYQNGEFTQVYDDKVSVCSVKVDCDGTLYALQMDGKLIRIYGQSTSPETMLDGLFHRLKNLDFGINQKIIYISTWGGGTYRVKLKTVRK